MFDRYVAVDWSANSTPKRGRDSIWIATLDESAGVVWNPATRAAAEEWLRELLVDAVDERTVVGVDFSLGYPVGTAEALGLDRVGATSAWRAMGALLANRVVDDRDNRNNRFTVASSLNERMTTVGAPFWGCPPAAATRTLTTTKPGTFGAVDEWRHVETVLRRSGRRPFSSWQLLGAGAVGSQSLLGIPMVTRLCAALGPRAHVWPFTTGLREPSTPAGTVVFAEVWPSLLAADATSDEVRDAVQVRVVTEWLAALDRSGRLGALFEPVVPDHLIEIVEGEEGWVLGVEDR